MEQPRFLYCGMKAFWRKLALDTMTIAEANALAREELVAEGMELVLTDGKVLAELSKTDKSLWKKITDWIADVIDKIRKHYGELNQASKTAQVLKETVESLEEIERLFTEGVREAGERTRTAETTTDTNDGGRKLSFAGERAANANVETLSEAKRRIEAGEDSEMVRQETGWFQGYDGKWRFEINDSEAIFFPSGDALFSKNHPEYVEYSDLTMKFITGDITIEEMERLTELGRTWGNEKRRLSDRLKGGGATLEDVLQHDKLFEAYPELREVRVVVEDMDGTEKGRYTKRTNTITISSKLSAKEARKTLAHEVQHKIQEIEGFALGASPEYWARRENERSRENLDVIDQEIRYFDQKLRQMEKESGYEEFEQEVFERAMNGEISEEQYDAEIDKFMEEHPDLKKATQHMENLRRIRGETARRERIEDPSLLYRRTAGEVEARDVEQRIDMTEDKRKNTRPDIDREDVVFAEGPTVSGSFAGWTADGTEVYVTSPDVMKLSLSDRIQKFRNDFLQNFKGKTAKFERNGHTYYARFVETKKGLGEFTFEGRGKNSKSDDVGYRAKVRLLADGDIFSIVEDGSYIGSSKEQGKNTASHANAKYWDYFWKEIFVDGKGYDVVINVRNDSTGNNLADKEQFVYSMTFRENKKVASPVTTPASSKQVGVIIGDSTIDSITQTDGSVNRKFSISDISLVEKYPNLNLNQDVSDMDGVPAIQLEDGSVLTFTEPHVTFIQNNGIDVEDIRSGGWITDGVYEPSERSDTLRYKERMLAKKRMDEKRAAKKDTIRYSIDEPPETPDVSENRDLTDREILGMALEGAVQSQEEYNIIKSYREQAAMLELVREKRDGYIKEANALERQIKALRARMESEGDPDGWIRKAMDDAIAKKREAERMRDEQVKILDNADRELLRMKAAKPFREILAREQKRIRAAERKAEKAEEKAERATETTRRVREEYKERIYKARREATDYKRAVYRTAYAKADEKNRAYRETMDRKAEESRERKEMTARKRTIMRVLGALQTKIMHPTKTNHVPKELHDLVEKFMKAADGRCPGEIIECSPLL